MYKGQGGCLTACVKRLNMQRTEYQGTELVTLAGSTSKAGLGPKSLVGVVIAEIRPITVVFTAAAESIGIASGRVACSVALDV